MDAPAGGQAPPVDPAETVKRGDVLVQFDRNALEVFLLLLCVVSGIASGARLAGTGITDTHLPDWLAAGWYLLLVLGGATGIAGIFWRDVITGVLILRAALWPVAAGALMYAALLVPVAGVPVAAHVAAFGIAAGLRAWQITCRVRFTTSLRRVIRQPRRIP